MPKRRKKEEIRCRYFRWLLGQRDGVYFADGRSNTPDLGRSSLGTKHKTEALSLIHDLDLQMAVKFGKADRSVLPSESVEMLELPAGRERYESHIKRPPIAGGPRPTTVKRYRAVLDKFLRYTEDEGLKYWNEINRKTLDGYASWLDGEGYAYATEYLELMTIKQMLKYFVEEELLPHDALFKYPLRKPEGTDTYCWKPEQVTAMLDHCERENLPWLRQVLIGLAATGLRIGELASLRWSDVNLDRKMISLTDESTRRRVTTRARRTTKSGYSRSFPINELLLPELKQMTREADGRVFHGPLGGRIKADTIRNILVRDVLTPLNDQFPSEPDEIGFQDGRLHSFRHYFCSQCANAGVTEQVLMRWLGHKNSKMVKRYYHLHDEESQRQMSRVQIIESSNTDTSVESE